jgi:hypothetical protein
MGDSARPAPLFRLIVSSVPYSCTKLSFDSDAEKFAI